MYRSLIPALKWLLPIIAFGGLSVFLGSTGRHAVTDGFGPVLIGANLTVAALAINFSFVTYQATEIRRFQHGLSMILLAGCLAVLAIAISPVVALVFDKSSVAWVGAATIPVLALLSVLLVSLAKREANPIIVMHRGASLRKWKKAIKARSAKISEARAKFESLNLVPLGNQSLHESDWFIQPEIPPSDPSQLVLGVGMFGVKNKNIECVVASSKHLIAALDLGWKLYYNEDAKFHGSSDHIRDAFQMLASEARLGDSTGQLSSGISNAVAHYIVNEAAKGEPSAEPIQFLSSLLVQEGCELLETRKSSCVARDALMAIRQVSDKGAAAWKDVREDPSHHFFRHLYWEHSLSNFASMIKLLGSSAVKAKDSHFLYLVLEGYGWLGCAAVKANNVELAKTCIRGLAQLGRESRSAKLECHWDRCALLPDHHALERIEWIVTWVPKADPEKQQEFLNLLGNGASRLRGKNSTYNFSLSGEKATIGIDYSEEPHSESQSGSGGHRNLDYSDDSMLKDYELYGF